MPQHTPTAETWHHLTLPVGGLSLHAVAAGSGSPVLLLHGFPDHWALWRPLLAPLAARHRVLAPDLRGINLSDKPLGVAAYRIDHLVRDVLALIDHLGGRCALVGHDWGGMLAWAVAARHPAAVSRLVILNAPHPCRFAQQLRVDPAQRAASAYLRLLTAAGAEERLAEQHFERLWSVVAGSTALPLSDAERSEHVAAWSQPGAITAMLNWYRALDVDAALSPAGVHALPDLAGASGHISMPTLVLWGERDGSFPPACLDGLGALVPQLQLRRFPEAGHWLLREEPRAVAQAVLNFLAATD